MLNFCVRDREERDVPLYEYECNKCHHRFELIEKSTAPETHKCPKCGGKAERQLAAPAIQFKGSGWYVTDYAGKNSSAQSGNDSGEKSDKSEKSESAPKKDSSEKPAKTESKPAKPAAKRNS